MLLGLHDITSKTQDTALSAGANVATHDLSLASVKLTTLMYENPDAATRVINPVLRNPSDVDMGNLNTIKSNASDDYNNAGCLTGVFAMINFSGGIIIPYDWDIEINYAGMTGSNNSRNTVLYENLR